jgi:predicted RNA-binding Zn ribbon-like protein
VEIDAVPLLGTDRTPHIVGSRLCLAAVNTVVWRRGPAPVEHLRGFTDLTELVTDAGWLVDRAELEARAEAEPRAAARAVTHGRELREQLLAVFSAVVAGATPPHDALAHIERQGARALSALRLVPRADGTFALGWPEPTIELPVQQLAVSALLLLSSPEIDRVKQCPGPTCGWVFLDSSRNRSRRWCSSAECGNRHRAQEHYRRTRAPAVSAAGG